MQNKKTSIPVFQYYLVLSILLLITNLVISTLAYLEIFPGLMATTAIFANVLFLIGIIILFFYLKKPVFKEAIIDSVTEHSPHAYTDQWLIQNIPQILCIKDGQGHWLIARNSFLNLLHIDPENYQGKTDSELSISSTQLTQILVTNYNHDESAWKKRETISRMTEIPRPDENVSIKLTKIPIFDTDGNRFKMITSGSQVTPGEQKQNALKLAASVFQQSVKSLVILDLQLQIMHINNSFSQLIGFSYPHVKGKSLAFLNEQDIDQAFLQNIHQHIKSQQFWEGELYCIRRDRALFPAKMNIAPVMSRSRGSIKHYVGIVTDLSGEKASEKQMVRLAHYDGLTSLPNRVMFIERLNQVLTNAKNQNSRVLLLFIDLDKFKVVNDTMGHSVGDILLKEVAERLTKSVRSHDLVARLSGDEFAVLIENNNALEQACLAASTIAKKIILLVSKVFHIQRKDLFIGASIGISTFPEDATNSQNLLKYADIAMYSAKEHGRNNFQFFKPEHITQLKTRHQLETDLHRALERQQFKLVYQPQFNLKNNQLVGVETLIRWHKDKRTVVLPNEFIPIAEDCGLIIPLGEWILATACQQQREWINIGNAPHRIAINISGRQFLEQHFIATIEKTLARSQLDPNNLQFEITESMLMGEMDKVIKQLHRIHDMGISLVIDDFGTGYSSLAYLKDFPIDGLKIDQSFIKNIPACAKEMKIVQAIIEMGHSLDLKIIAEGVETAEQLEFLKEAGCNSIQGYLLGRPAGAETITALIHSANGKPVAFSDIEGAAPES